MVITQQELEPEEKEEFEKKYELIKEEKAKEDLEFHKPHHNIVYKILKYNPIDFLNDIGRRILKEFNFLEKADELNWWVAYIWVKEAVRRLWNYRVESKSLFPEYGAGIVVGNHQSHIDPFFIGAATTRRIRWMSKEENFRTPIMKSLFTNLGAFRLYRDIKDMRAWDMSKTILEKGGWVGIFPEGTRTIDGSIGEFRTGAVRLAIEMGVPIVPTAVVGSENALPKGKFVMKPASVVCRVGKPISYDDYDIETVTYEEVRRLTDELRDIVVSLKDGTYFQSEEEKISEQLSIGSPKDANKLAKAKPGWPKSFKGWMKKLSNDFLQLWDDSWYSLMKALDLFGSKRHFQEAIYHFSGNLVNKFCELMLPYKLIDYDKYIPEEECGAVICSNHNSEWDVIILATSFQQRGDPVYQMAKESLFRIPVVNGWVRSCFAFPLKRGGHDIGSYEFAKKQLKEGRKVIIYPEGTTNSGGGKLLEGHTGAIRLAIEAKVPIILVGITGTEDIYPKHGKMLNFGKSCILKAGEIFREHEKYFDKPMPDYKELKRLTDNMMSRIEDLLMYDDHLA